ncbi:hypothetical protein MHUMG1_03430 [Metarhizium humberi]|uniref:Cell wall glucanase n=1 Tax=Metarhizium humberi TaxID=2596975 RepID=A0A9P8SAC1_9HYPO|nr:hypothetical protein MHUMG1_03430 [Metarhizium humberi]
MTKWPGTEGKFSIKEHARFVPLPQLNLQFLTEILVRDRKIMTLNAGCSVLPHRQEPRFVQELRDLGYRVDLRERKRENRDFKAGEASSSDEFVFSRNGGRYVEELVDETLQTRIAESVMEFFKDQGTLVIATGDARPAKYSDGFFAYAERALRMGWNVEVVSWRASLSSHWNRPNWVEQWSGRFRVIELDDYIDHLLNDNAFEPIGPGESSPSESFGISYTPYRSDQNCKSQQDVDDDIQRLAGYYSVVRVYGTDCDQVPLLYSAAKKHDMKLFLGIWNPSSVEDEANKIISGVDGDWDMVHTVSVGNERVNNGEASPQDLIWSMSKARSILREAGYDGPVVIVDTFRAVLAHPELCDESDYCAINAHAFFDGTVAASQSGEWLKDTVSKVQSRIAADKRVVVTETGWPMQGGTNGLAVPGLDNQKVALDAIREEFVDRPQDVILFSAFNDLWKQKNSATFEADPFWGIGGAVSSCDQ